MINNKMYIYFIVNMQNMTITQCSKKEYLNLDFNTFFEKELKKIVVDPIDEFKANVLIEYLKTCKSVQFDSKIETEYYFDIAPYDTNNVGCSLYIITKKDIEQESNIDFLTGVYNRSFLTKEIESRLLNGTSKNYALGIVDLNNFKNINDKYGHLAGDKVLRSFANEIGEASKGALFGRYGGDEFIIFIENPTNEMLVDLAKKILNITYKRNENKKDNVTACVGFSKTNGGTLSFDYLFETADVALYKAKKSGKRSAYLDDKVIYSINKGIRKRSKNQNLRLFDMEMKNTKIKQISICIGIIVLFMCLVSFVTLRLRSSIFELNINETNSKMSMVSEQIETNIDKSIDSYFSQLAMINQLVSYDNLENNYKDILNGLDGKLEFERVGLLLSSGDIVFSDRNYNIAQEKLAMEVIVNNKPFIDNIYFNKIGQRMVLAVPYDNDGTELSGIVGVVTIDEFKKYLNASAFNGTSTVAITNDDGNFIAISGNQEFEKKNILTTLRRALGDEKYKPVKEAFINNNSKTINVNLSGTDALLYFNSFNMNADYMNSDVNWHIIITVPTIEINKTISDALNIILIFFLILGVVLILILTGFLLFFSSGRIKVKRNKAIDDITGGLNYNRFLIDANTLANTKNDYAIVLSDSIKFKYINEQIGKQKGDDLLKEIHDIYLSHLTKDELIARVYADRFIMLLHNKDLDKRILGIYDEIKRKISYDYNINIYNVYGIFNPQRKIDDIAFAENMARIALKSVKDNYALTPIGYFDSTMYINQVTLNSLEQKAESALRNDSFVVYYQAKKNIQSDSWCSCEALVRWKDEKGGLISPSSFIPLFEGNGFITKLDLHMFELVCKDIRSAIDSGDNPLSVSINVSRKHFINEDFLRLYKEIIKKYNVPHDLIEFEITESAVFENESILGTIIKEIHEMGCKCSIDDFGTGYSSLSMLTNYDFDIIKLDRSFFYGKNGFTDSSKEVVKAIINLAHKLNKLVVAEGVEELSMVSYLKNAKCDMIQGYYYAKPLPKEEFLKLVKGE